MKIILILSSFSVFLFHAHATLTPEEVYDRLEQKLWGIEIRLMHLERQQYTPQQSGGMQSPGALVRRHETLRRKVTSPTVPGPHTNSYFPPS